MLNRCALTGVLAHLPADVKDALQVLDSWAELTLQAGCCSQTTSGTALLDLQQQGQTHSSSASARLFIH